MSISSFFRNLAQDAQESYRFAREYWQQHTLSQGYAEVVRETTQAAHDYFRRQDILTQSVAGASLGVAHLLGGLPIGLIQWSVDVAQATVRRGPIAGAVELVRNPLMGMVEGGRSVIHALGRWASGSLLERDSFEIAQEVATVLGTGGLLLMGARDLGSGGRGLLQQTRQIRITPRTFHFEMPGLTPALAAATTRPALQIRAWEVRAPAFHSGPLGPGAVAMASVRRPPDNQIVPASGEPPPPRRISPEVEPEAPPALLPLNGRNAEEAALFAGDYQRFLPNVRQLASDALPPAVQRRLLELIERSAVDGFEREFLAIELADGTILHSDFIHSRSPFRVDNPRAKDRALQLLMDSANQHLSAGNPPVRVHAYHSHPRRSRVHADGRAFTETNSIDCRAWEGYLDVFAARLRRLGFRGRLEISGGAVPVEGGNPGSNPYVAAFRQSLEVGEHP